MTRRLLVAALLLAGCSQAAPEEQRTAAGFPKAERPVAATVSGGWSTEPDRDRLKEAEAVMTAAGIRPGMTVADIGAGEGYYTIRLAARVGAKGRVLAEDIVPSYHDRLAERVYRDRLDNVSVKLGKPADPGLPPHSFDRIFMVHMYHEIEEPYEFLWRLRPALAPTGMVVVVDADRATQAHGTPPALLDCEFKAIGYALVERKPMPQAGGYLALYKAVGPRPKPADMHACRA
ncbi:class I SAM-dependent methyltransferase [Sphingomonas crusticola]|uniref:class I SAM-dependent methyltransferase n=1 Tax=Sphingomonas crusticola TaxID=1697973 RepID=UPI000E2280BC|nr:methyltransferase domain-containing protein [Sphingomonas crusticola]